MKVGYIDESAGARVCSSPESVSVLSCQHRWQHIPERDWVGGINGHRVKLVFFCEQCLEIETRVVER